VKIAFIVHDYHRHGGHARYVAELSARFKKKHEVHVYTSIWEEPNPEGIHFHRVPSFRWTALTTVISFIIPGSFIPFKNYDIVHAQGLCGIRQNIVTSHICNKAWFEAAEKYGGPLPWRKMINKWIITLLEKMTYRPSGAEYFIAVSNRIKGDLVREHRIPKNKIKVIHHGVDLSVFNPDNNQVFGIEIKNKLGLPGNEIIFLYVGDWQKAGPVLAEAIGKVDGSKLLVVTKTCKEIVWGDLKKYGSIDRVILCEPTREIEKFYCASDVFVFPSYYDSFGMVVTEAMASGIPVITNHSVGAAEIVTDGLNGILTKDPWDPNQLADAMQKFVDDPELSKRMGASARLAVEGLTWDDCANQTMNVYKEFLNKKL